MSSYHNAAQRELAQTDAPDDRPATVSLMPDEETRNCPFCNESISVRARKCWRCHEFFSPPLEEIDDRTYQFARREVLQDCVSDIRKWITRIGFGSMAGIAVVALLGMLRFQDVLEQIVADRVQETAGPVLEATEAKLDESDDVLDAVQDKIRLAQHRISQFDWLTETLSETEASVLQIKDARNELETRATRLADQFGQLEHRLINAKRELRDDRDRRLEELLGSFANQVVTFDKLDQVLEAANDPTSQQLLAALSPLKHRQIRLVGPQSLSADDPAVLFSSSVRLSWQYGRFDVGDVTYRVELDTQPDFRSAAAQTTTTRLTNFLLPVDFPHGPVYWRVEAMSREGDVVATSDVGHFEFYTDAIDRIRSTGVIRVGVAYSSQGEFAYFDEQQGRLTGFDIELTRWLATRVLPDLPNVRPVFLNYDWRQLFKSVSRNEVDLIISTITITPEREEEFSLTFSHPYYRTAQACVVLKESGIRSAAQLQGRRIAVQSGTTSETVGEAFTEPSRLFRSANSDASFDALLRGQVDAVITDYDFAQGDVRKLGRAAAVIALRETDFPPDYDGVRSEEYGIAVAKPETYLLARINNAIDAAARANILESLRLQFVTGEPVPNATPATPTTEIAAPSVDSPRVLNTLRR